MRPALRLLGLIAAILAGAAQADERYPRTRLAKGSVFETPAPVAEFIATVRKLRADGHLAAGKGMEPLAELGGLSAKGWLISRVAEDFICLRDHGGMCPDQAPLAHLKNFVARFTDDGGPWQRLMSATSPEELPLDAYGLRLRAFEGDVSLASATGDMVCVPALAATDRPVRDAINAYLGSNDDLLLEKLELFRMAHGRYRIRRTPSLEATTVGRLHNELVFVPAPGLRLTSRHNGRSYAWVFVVPAEGEPGFVAFDPGDLLPTSATSLERICMTIENGVVKIAAHIGGGD